MESEERILTTEQIDQLFIICEFRVHVKVHERGELQIECSQYGKIDRYFKKTVAFQFQEIVLEAFYFIFCCFKKQIFPELHPQFLVFSHEEELPKLLFARLLHQKDLLQEIDAQCPYFTLYYRLINQMVKVVKKSSEKLIQQDDEQVPFDFERLNKSLESMKSLISKDIEDKQCFTEFEKTTLVKERSVLFKIRNCSVALMIFRTQQLQGVLQSFRQKQKQYLAAIKQKRVLHKNYKEEKEIQSKIQVNLLEYMQTFKTNPIFIKSIDHNSHSDSTTLSQQLKFKLKFKPIQDPIKYEDLVPKQPSPSAYKPIQYTIEYLSDKQLLAVRVNAGIVERSEILYKWNALTFSIGTIRLQLVEKVEFQKKKRELYLKGVTEIGINDSLIIKCLKLIDFTMSALIVVEKWLMMSQKDQREEIVQLEEGYKQIQHYVMVISKLNEQVYRDR